MESDRPIRCDAAIAILNLHDGGSDSAAGTDVYRQLCETFGMRALLCGEKMRAGVEELVKVQIA